MPLSLDNILSNPELEKSVSLEWVKGELDKQPYNKYLQGLFAQKSNVSTGFSSGNSSQLVESIISESVPSTKSSYFIKDVVLKEVNSFAEAREKISNQSMITSAAIGAGAIATGSIVSGAKEAASSVSLGNTEPLSNTEQIEESGFLGFLNRLDETIEKKQANPKVDPMLKRDNYTRGEAEESNVEEHAQEHSPTLTEPEEQEEQEEESHPEMLIFTDDVKKKKKKKAKVKPKKQYRWSSQTPADYEMKGLDPFTVWINTIDGVELTAPSKKKSKKKGKKKKKKFKESLESKPEIASELLAELLVNQGHNDDAIAMYEQLSLKNPEKSSFFAAKIKTIKDKI